MLGSGQLCLVWLLVAVGCQQMDVEHQSVPCSTARDCPSDRPHCIGAPVPDRPAVVICSDTCRTDSECSPGRYCAVGQRICYECLEGCQTAGCADGETCQSDGRCVLTPCSAPDAPPCPLGWHCDPSAALSVNDGAKSEPSDATRFGRGCARNSCSDDDGTECADLWRCDPEHSDFSSGCLPLSCYDTGRCSDETAFICDPSGDGQRPGGTDPHGCVHRNCEEGVICEPLRICDAGACRPRRCDEISCPAGTHCAPGATGVNTCFTDPRTDAGTGGTSSVGGADGTTPPSNTAGMGGTRTAQLGECE